jgi:hypothetical protein
MCMTVTGDKVLADLLARAAERARQAELDVIDLLDSEQDDRTHP